MLVFNREAMWTTATVDKGVREEVTFMAEADMRVTWARLGMWRRKMFTLLLC